MLFFYYKSTFVFAIPTNSETVLKKRTHFQFPILEAMGYRFYSTDKKFKHGQKPNYVKKA